MKKLFIVASKLVGILALYWAIGTIVQIGFALSTMSRMPEELRLQGSWWLLGTIAYGALTLLLAYALLFKTELLAEVLKITDDSGISPLPPVENIVHAGAILIGAYVLLLAIPDLGRHLLITVRYKGLFKDFSNLSQLLAALLKVGLAVWVLRNPGKVVAWMRRERSSEPSA
ncbi:MAG: hypothetical protein V1873_08835 [Verrucomicrobiota bacterium]